VRKDDEERDMDDSLESPEPKVARPAPDTGTTRGSIPPPTREELDIDAGWGGGADDSPKPAAARPVAAKPAPKPAAAKPAAARPVAKPAAAKPVAKPAAEAPKAGGPDLAKQLFEQVFGKKDFKAGASKAVSKPISKSVARSDAKPARTLGKPVARSETKPSARAEVKPEPKRKARKAPKPGRKHAAPDKRNARKARKADEKAARLVERQAEYQASNRAAQNATRNAETRRLEREEYREARDSQPDLVEAPSDGDGGEHPGSGERRPRPKSSPGRKPTGRKGKRARRTPKRMPDVQLETMRPSEEDTSAKAFERLPVRWLVVALVAAGALVFLAMQL